MYAQNFQLKAVSAGNTFNAVAINILNNDYKLEVSAPSKQFVPPIILKVEKAFVALKKKCTIWEGKHLFEYLLTKHEIYRMWSRMHYAVSFKDVSFKSIFINYSNKTS